MNKKSYLEKLKDPRWQKKRLEVLEYFGWQCCICESKEKTLTVHHKQYLKNCEPWEYPNRFLVALCEDCHREEREAKKRLDILYVLIQVEYPTYKLVALFEEIFKQHVADDEPKKSLPEAQTV